MPPSPIARLRRLCLALPEAHEVEAWGEPTFRVRNKLFATFASAANHHGAGRPAAWVKAAPGNQPFMVAHAPDRFFVPPYVGPSGWVGVWLDVADWDELRELLEDAWRLTAPKRVAALLPTAGAEPPKKSPNAKKAPRVTKPSNKSQKVIKSPIKSPPEKKSVTRAARPRP